MSTMKMSGCMKIVAKMDQDDQDSLLARLDQYQADGVPAERAQVMAASDTLAELEAERKEFMALLREQHPDLFLVKPEPAKAKTEVQASERRDVVDTPQFKRWFGNSQVVDAEGNPLVVYHGTNTEFAEFKAGDGMLGKGIYFTPNAKSAQLYPMLQNMRTQREGREAGAISVMPVYVSLRNPLVLTDLPASKVDATRVASQGYDGIVLLNPDGTTKELTAFRPEQIKSATGNNGDFDATNPDIRKSERIQVKDQTETPEFKNWFGDWQASVILNGNSIASLKTSDAPTGGFKAIADWAASIFRIQGGKAIRAGFGEVVLDQRAAKTSMAHGGANKYKKIAFAAAKDVIERGALVWQSTGGREDSFYFSAPVDIDGSTNIETVLVHRDPNTQRMYLHSVTAKESLLNHQVSSADTEVSERSGSTDSEGLETILQNLIRRKGVSQVIDAQGKPLVVYHGAKEDIEDGVFRMEKGMLGIGAYFTSNPQEADFYTANAVWRTDPNIVPAYVSIKNPYIAKDKWDKGALKAKENGHDGVILMAPGGGIDWAIPFSATQIKSAIGNAGTFDPANPDIRKSERKSIETNADAIAAMDAGVRDDTELGQFPGGPEAYNLYEARTLLKKPSDKLKRVTENNSFSLWQDYDYIANVDGEHFGVAKQEDPDEVDDETQFVYSFDSLKDGRDSGKSTTTDQVDVLFKEMRASMGDIRKSERRSALGFTSALAKGIDDMPTKQAMAGAWQAQIKGLVNKGVVKADELEWSGLTDWLELQEGKVPKAQIAEYLAQGGVRVEEVTLGGKSADQQRVDLQDKRDRSAAALFTGDDTTINGKRVFDDELGYMLLDGDLGVDQLPNAKQAPAQEWIDAYKKLQNFEPTSAPRTKYSQYTLPGGENYREVLLTLPEKRPDMKAIAAWQARMLSKYGPDMSRMMTAEEQAEGVALNIEPKQQGSYRSSHWDAPNVIAHLRLNDRTDAEGGKVLFVEEIQSDWGQDGKKKGFATNGKLPDGWIVVEQPTYRYRNGPQDGTEWMVYDRTKTQVGVGSPTREDAIASATGGGPLSGVPVAPFVTKTDGWLNLALKRVMIMAAEGGYDKVAFVNGEQSADRYDLSKQVNYVQWNHGYDGVRKLVQLEPSDGETIGFTVLADGTIDDSSLGWDGKQLDEVIGKELAEKIMAKDDGDLRGLDLKVGGEGMKTFYDQIVPQAVKKMLPKVGGGQVGNVQVGKSWEQYLAGRGFELRDGKLFSRGFEMNASSVERQYAEEFPDGALQQPGFDVTPAMRDKVAGGLPLFSRRRSANEDREDYTGAYETDLFGQSLPEDDRARSGSGVDAATGGNLQPAAALRDTSAPQGEYFARTFVGSEVERKLGTDRILTPEQAAQATAYLYRSAVERLDGIITDIDGKPLAAVGGFKGALSQTSVYPATIMAEAVRVPGAARIWFSHNHPSGTATLSRADENLNGIMTDVFLGSGIEPMGLLAVTGKRFAHVDPSGNVTSGDMLAPTASMTVPAIERELADSDFQPMLIDSPTAAKMAAKTFEAKGGDGLILLNAKNEVVGWLPISDLMRGRLRNTGGLNAIYRALSESNAGAAILVHRGSLDVNGGFGGSVTVGNNIAAALVKADVRPLDSVNVATGASLAEQGGLIAAGPVYSSRRQTETPAFKRWFGDSQVVDENGNPRVMHHGTARDFSVFDRLKSTEWRRASMDTVGSWFSSESRKAEQYAADDGLNVMPVYLSIQNPKLYRSFDDFLREMHAAEGRSLKDQNPPGLGSTEGLRAKLKAEGYDGIQFEQTDNASLYKDMQEVQDAIERARDDEFSVKRAERSPYTMKRERLESTLRSMQAELQQMGGSTEFDGHDVFVAFDPTQIKSAIGNDGSFDATNPDIRKSERRQATDQSETPQFKRWSNDAPLVKLGDTHLFRSGQPVVVEALHGTTNVDLTEFLRDRANVESDFGAGFYASNSAEDVATNYANDAGPDLTSKVERLAEQLEQDDEFEGDHGEALRLARAQLSDSAPNTLKLFMRFKNPAVLGGKGETYFDYSEAYNEETDEYGEPTGLLMDFVNALDEAGDGIDVSMRDIESTKAKIFDAAEGDGLKFGELARIVKDNMLDASSLEDGSSAGSEMLRQALAKMGFDGVIDSTVNDKFGPKVVRAGQAYDRAGGMKGMTQDTVHFIAFEPNQVKSAIGNNGDFSLEKNDIAKSIRAGNSAWDEPEGSRFDDLVYKLQDKLIDTKRVIESITKTVGRVADDLNVYLQEELFHGRTAKATEDFGSQELKPLLQQMKAEGLTIADVEEYLHARHAQEANALIASREPTMPDGGSGMTNADAANYLQNLPVDQSQKLAAIAQQVDTMVAKTRQMYADYGLESQDTVNGWGQMFQHYVPLQREDKDGAMGIGQGFSIKGKEVKGRTGSTRKVVDILANIAMQRERLIVRGEKNRVAEALLGLASANPNPDFWAVGPPPTTRVYDPKTNRVVDRPDPMYKSRPNVLVAKVKRLNGDVDEVAVVFKEDNDRALRMASALKNLDAGNLEGLLGVSAKITRYFAAVNTQYNPVFGVVNLLRDVQGAMVSLGSTPLNGKQGRIARDTMSALRGIYGDIRAERKGAQGSSPWSALWDEFQAEGGQTGYRDLFKTSADRADQLQSILTPDGWMASKLGRIFTAGGALKVPMSQAKKGADWIFGWLSDYNEAMENGVRLAAYKAGLDQGMSKQQAASLAKNLTVNFNRKGQIGQQAGAVYAFFNAAMQGSARLGQTLFEMEKGDLKTLRLSKTGKTVVYGGMLLGVTQALLLAAAGFDDEDPPEFVRERSLVIPTGGKRYITIPMPLGLHVIPGLGRHATEFALSGFKKPAKRAISVAGMFLDAFNPIGNAGMSIQTLAPTAIDPLVALTENRDWTGKPIARVSSNKAIPGFTQFKDTATAPGKLIAEAINWMSGGNQYVAGVISPTPDQIDYLLGQVTGGVGRELSKVEQTGKSMFNGEDLPSFKVPLLGRFYGNAAQQASQGGAFYNNLNELNALETEVKLMRKDGKNQEAGDLLRSRPDAYLIAQANVAERQVQKLRREKRELIAKDASRDQVRAKEEQITRVMSRLNGAVEQLKERVN